MTDDTDFKSIVQTHQEKVRNTCFRFVKNIEDADDIAQEVFVQVYESLSHFRDEAALSTWIYRIAVNKSLDFIRKKKRKKRFGIITSLFGFQDDNEEEILPSDSNPGRELEENERNQILRKAIDLLPDNQKTAITLSKLDGFSNKEIAAIMDISLSALEALIHRSKKNLQKHLADYFEKKL